MVHLCRMKISKALQYRGDKNAGTLRQLVIVKSQKDSKEKQAGIYKPRSVMNLWFSKGRKEGVDFPSLTVFRSKSSVCGIEGLNKRSSCQSPYEHLNCLWALAACFHMESSLESKTKIWDSAVSQHCASAHGHCPCHPQSVLKYTTFRVLQLLLVLQHRDWIYLCCRRFPPLVSPNNCLAHEQNPHQSSRLLISHQEE